MKKRQPNIEKKIIKYSKEIKKFLFKKNEKNK